MLKKLQQKKFYSGFTKFLDDSGMLEFLQNVLH